MFALWQMDELQKRDVATGRATRRVVAEGRPLRDVPTYRCEVTPTSAIKVGLSARVLSITPSGEIASSQIALSEIARSLRSVGWRIGNREPQLRLAAGIALIREGGWRYLRPGEHWRVWHYRLPMTVEREEQQYKDGFDSLIAVLNEQGADAQGVLVTTLVALTSASHKAIAGSLSGNAAHEYYMSTR